MRKSGNAAQKGWQQVSTNPMPHGDPAAQVQRFATHEDPHKHAETTIEEREEMPMDPKRRYLRKVPIHGKILERGKKPT